MNSWKCYNRALVSNCAPHELPNLEALKQKRVWSEKGKPLLARWIDNFDCGYETNWWYVIKDTPFDISALKAKRRYEINKGLKNFDVKRILASDYCEDIYNIRVKAFSAYPEKYRPTVDKNELIASLSDCSKNIVYGAFSKENGELCGYAYLTKQGKCLDYNVHKTNPEYEHLAINAAIVYGILEDNVEHLSNGGYICDGSRSISHETAFQDYLEKYFEFRKAYCHLHVKYKPGVNFIVKLLYPFRRILKKFDNMSKIHKINAVLLMENIVRGEKND